jgi:predicted GIY-YIG superfamily endonuclease
MGEIKVVTNNILPIVGLNKYLHTDLADAIYAALFYLRIGFFQYFENYKKVKHELGPGCYLYLDNRLGIAYVGMSGKMKGRLYDHKDYKKKDYSKSEIIVIPTRSKTEAKQIESIIGALTRDTNDNVITTFHGKSGIRK